MSIVTLISDWQDKDYYIAAVKGKLYSHIPDVTIVDITHNVPQDGLATAYYLLSNAYTNFPKGTIHIIGLMDIESKNSPHIAVNYEGHYFIGADHGYFYDIFTHEPEEIFEINIYQEGSTFTFPSRDRFPLVAASIVRDGDLSKIGNPSSLKPRVVEPLNISPRERNGKMVLEIPILHVDATGNVVLDIKKARFTSILKQYSFFMIRIRGGYNDLLRINKISEAYPDVRQADGCAIFLDNDYLELSINNDSFTDMTGLGICETVVIEFSKKQIT
ncbi:MAG: SAM-dependent chlorinase/fluorinase [Bacteroidales bacterium]|jgi:S-adenosylmethionine hydrolase|nr:SAM-dependent chlorinase/fluorinase [Bacteroidales bacterium]